MKKGVCKKKKDIFDIDFQESWKIMNDFMFNMQIQIDNMCTEGDEEGGEDSYYININKAVELSGFILSEMIRNTYENLILSVIFSYSEGHIGDKEYKIYKEFIKSGISSKSIFLINAEIESKFDSLEDKLLRKMNKSEDSECHR